MVTKTWFTIIHLPDFEGVVFAPDGIGTVQVGLPARQLSDPAAASPFEI